jgi:hypothetical protein
MTFLDADRIQSLNGFGEDTCDLLHTIEASFGIEFSDDELVSSTTIRELGECISRKLEQPASEQCLNVIVFNRLRRAFVDLFDIPRSAINPGTPLGTLMPWINRRRRWHGIQDHLGLILPDLRWPIWPLELSLVIVITLIAPNWTSVTSRGGLLSGIVLALGGVLAWALVLRFLAPLARGFPRSCDTFGDLVKLALARNYGTVASQRGRSSDKEVLLVLRQLIAAETDISLKDVTAESCFPDGLNIF